MIGCASCERTDFSCPHVLVTASAHVGVSPDSGRIQSRSSSTRGTKLTRTRGEVRERAIQFEPWRGLRMRRAPWRAWPWMFSVRLGRNLRSTRDRH
jgi:hypothetical protein